VKSRLLFSILLVSAACVGLNLAHKGDSVSINEAVVVGRRVEREGEVS
jgi:hypothetical protein